jgi:hypothetical protein
VGVVEGPTLALMISLTLDADDAQLLRAFWKAALGYVDEPPPAPFVTREEWHASFGLPADDRVEDGAWLCDPAGLGPRLSILKVPEPKVAKNRLHLDVPVPVHGSPDERWAQLLAEAERLVALGGSVLATFAGHHVVMADPEGNEFCVAPSS